MPIIKNKYFQLFLSLIVFSFTGVMSKMAALSGFGVRFFVFYGISLLIMFVYAIFWQQILKKFTLITATASKGIIVVLNLLWAAVIFREHISLTNLIGAAIIIAGIVIVASGEAKDG